MVIGLPYEHLNLRFNPFCEPTKDEWMELAVGEPPEVKEGEVRQVLGRSGRGKTTYLLSLLRRMPSASYVRVDPPPAPSPKLPPKKTPVFLLDEAQALKPRSLKRVFRRYETLVFTSHVDFTRSCPRSLNTVFLDGLTPEKLKTIIRRRFSWARRNPGPVPKVPRDVVELLIQRWGDDVRAILNDLYDAIQRLKDPGNVQM